MSNLPDQANLSIALSSPDELRFGASAQPVSLEAEVIALFDQLRSPLLRYVLSFGLSRHDAEEVVQEVFLALFQHLHRGKSRRNLRGWIFRVGHNQALKLRLRNAARAPLHDQEDAAEQHPDSRGNPEENLVREERQRRLLAAVGLLPEHDRYCLFLRAEGLRYREIAQVLGISLGAVSISLARSLGRLTNADESSL
jgi:RNA polymerase sigma-70 factor (ECF subfamily)